jgi:DNA-binding PadR family transcriptional regulator
MFRYLILGLLRSGARMHGYAMVKEYRERSGIEVSTGNFYRELQRLVLDGLIRAAANPPGADARRTPYEITDVGASVFDEWFLAQHAAAGAAPEDDISARALFIADADSALVARVLDRLRENLWFTGKTLERDRQQAIARAAEDASSHRVAALPLLLARRLKHIAADLEFVEELREAVERAAAPPVAELSRARLRPARKRETPPTAVRRL